MPNLHKTQSIPTSTAHATQRHPQWPVAGDHSQWLQSQRQRLPSHLQSFQKYPFLYKVNSKSALSLSQKLQDLMTQYGHPQQKEHWQWLSIHVRRFWAVSPMAMHRPYHSLPHFPQPNSFIKLQVKTHKTALSISQDARMPLKTYF